MTLTENGPDLATATVGRKPGRGGKAVTYILLIIGAIAFLFPFYYMVVGSLQKDPDTSLAGAFPTGGLTFANYSAIDSRINLLGSLVNSGFGRASSSTRCSPRARRPTSGRGSPTPSRRRCTAR